MAGSFPLPSPSLILAVQVRSNGPDWLIPLHGIFVKEPLDFFVIVASIPDSGLKPDFDLFYYEIVCVIYETAIQSLFPSHFHPFESDFGDFPVYVFVATCRIDL